MADSKRRLRKDKSVPWIAIFIGLVTVAVALYGATSLRNAGPLPATRPDFDAALRMRVREVTPTIRRCYERSLADDAELSGRVSVGFVIQPGGEVTDMVVTDEIHDDVIAACVRGAFDQLHFDAAPGTEPVAVEYPIWLTTGDAPDAN